MKKRIGTVTIGQSPRVDVIPEITAILGSDVEIAEAGALDGLTHEEIAGMAPGKEDYVLVTRLADGTSVQVAERCITPRIHRKIDEHFESGIQLVLLLCTGEFPDFETGGLLIRPQKVLFNAVAAVAEGRRLGILTPSPEQVVQAERRWKQVGKEVRAVPSSPYIDALEQASAAARELKEWGADITVMDCIGYTGEMRRLVAEITGKPVVLARGIAARTVAELLG